MDRLAEDLWSRPTGETTMWHPNAELHQTDGELQVNIELPGVPKEQVNLESTEDYLRVTGERKPLVSECPEGGYCCTEMCYGPFERTIYWPMRVQSDQTKAAYRDGILQVTVPLAEEEKARRPRRVTVE